MRLYQTFNNISILDDKKHVICITDLKFRSGFYFIARTHKIYFSELRFHRIKKSTCKTHPQSFIIQQ